jgi:hypothetical protein
LLERRSGSARRNLTLLIEQANSHRIENEKD